MASHIGGEIAWRDFLASLSWRMMDACNDKTFARAKLTLRIAAAQILAAMLSARVISRL